MRRGLQLAFVSASLVVFFSWYYFVVDWEGTRDNAPLPGDMNNVHLPHQKPTHHSRDVVWSRFSSLPPPDCVVPFPSAPVAELFSAENTKECVDSNMIRVTHTSLQWRKRCNSIGHDLRVTFKVISRPKGGVLCTGDDYRARLALSAVPSKREYQLFAYSVQSKVEEQRVLLPGEPPWNDSLDSESCGSKTHHAYAVIFRDVPVYRYNQSRWNLRLERIGVSWRQFLLPTGPPSCLWCSPWSTAFTMANNTDDMVISDAESLCALHRITDHYKTPWFERWQLNASVLTENHDSVEFPMDSALLPGKYNPPVVLKSHEVRSPSAQEELDGAQCLTSELHVDAAPACKGTESGRWVASVDVKRCAQWSQDSDDCEEAAGTHWVTSDMYTFLPFGCRQRFFTRETVLSHLRKRDLQRILFVGDSQTRNLLWEMISFIHDDHDGSLPSGSNRNGTLRSPTAPVYTTPTTIAGFTLDLLCTFGTLKIPNQLCAADEMEALNKITRLRHSRNCTPPYEAPTSDPIWHVRGPILQAQLLVVGFALLHDNISLFPKRQWATMLRSFFKKLSMQNFRGHLVIVQSPGHATPKKRRTNLFWSEVLASTISSLRHGDGSDAIPYTVSVATLFDLASARPDRFYDNSMHFFPAEWYPNNAMSFPRILASTMLLRIFESFM